MTANINIKSILKSLKEGDIQKTIEGLRSTASPQAPLVTQNQYNNIGRKIITKLPDNIPIIKIAFLANVTLEHWVESLNFWLLLEGYKLKYYIVPIGTWHQEILDTSSALYSFKPDITWFFLHQSELNFDYGVLYNEELAKDVVSQSTNEIKEKILYLNKNCSSITLVNNIVPPVERVFGNYEGAINTSPAALIKHFNLGLSKVLPKGASIFDIGHIASSVGLSNWHDTRLWKHSKHPFSFNVQAQVAFSAARLLSAIKGQAKKCIVLDLDNTLWGGVIGDDGINGIKVGPNNGAVGEVYSDFQKWIKALSNRGVTLAICSKNDLALAQEPFNKKEGMVLKLSDFASFHANWDNKVDNIKQIAEEINIGLNSLVFVDDNPAERELIRNTLPEVAVPELPLDPSGYIQAIDAGKWFETIGITKEDKLRSQAYQQNQARKKGQNNITNLSSFLQDLEMVAKWKEVDTNTLTRSAQLINKTNQFNMTTARYTEAQITEFINSKNHWVGEFSLSDRFGDLGIISIIILENINEKIIINTWVMSCRVFSRGMEYFIFDKVYKIAKKQGKKELVGQFIPSPKNKVVGNLYERLGGKVTGTPNNKENIQWKFDLNKPAKTNDIFITEFKELI